MTLSRQFPKCPKPAFANPTLPWLAHSTLPMQQPSSRHVEVHQEWRRLTNEVHATSKGGKYPAS